jgi:hypothetical protein
MVCFGLPCPADVGVPPYSSEWMVTPTKASVKWLEIPELGLLTGYRGKRQEGVDMSGGTGAEAAKWISSPVLLQLGECVARDRLAHLRVTYYRVTYQ